MGTRTSERVILAGDILDANISSLTRAIEGRQSSGSWPRQIGFRYWLTHLFAEDKFDVERVVYIPGNHDYIIWNILSTNKVFVDPISEGKVPTNLPLMEGTFPQPFIRGVAPPKVRDRFIVVYPDYEFDLAGRSVLVTHGHYLDEKQTLFRHLDALIEKEHGNKRKAIRKFFIGTAQYQAVANAVSYLKGTQQFVEKAYKSLSSIVDAVGRLRNKQIDAGTLKAIEMYLCYFRNKKPDVFIFGHTHEAGRSNTATLGRDRARRLIEKDIEVFNDGCFLRSVSKRLAGTFIVADDSPESGSSVKLLEVDAKGRVREKSNNVRLSLPPEPTKRVRVGWTMAKPPADLGTALETRVSELCFDRESGGGTGLGEIAVAERGAPLKAARTEVPRLLQGNLGTLSESGFVPENRGFIVGTRYHSRSSLLRRGRGLLLLISPSTTRNSTGERGSRTLCRFSLWSPGNGMSHSRGRWSCHEKAKAQIVVSYLLRRGLDRLRDASSSTTAAAFCRQRCWKQWCWPRERTGHRRQYRKRSGLRLKPRCGGVWEPWMSAAALIAGWC